ncbi:30S ribosomal protein S2 [bacterium (Candidatus Gribaldobacteria) CG23_combo_of_CG06-09_8_20_14_all_37_87_8]|uniref:Small ribosomal subunit protein uS2 n=2 Tax=Candidatus Gribaldobacteria TaxID=2798536 RepID=A0A2G9ZF43_9BACT|nr:MAG: 30S ribosomal protein S2 [Parcubacteria group bacterium CG1_02_37_13]PIP31795.1 MAG: 30S ribosomal protein S2 [bacterium (Candidatus Gribaldobacteria) CG23_combo_of_CG06-09_8_20_14_all_37_87_8]PIR90679.1 MAG: 30S ribosomal protein S2 [bacterium (Candidatus Gribaldobacteria) CG10_big_fil_rev_8_21_14_0_10_37_21]
MAEEKEKLNTKVNVEDMQEAGLHLGHKTSKLNPKTNEFVLGIKNTVHVFDLEQTAKYLQKAIKFIEELGKEKKIIMFVSTKPPLKRLVKEVAIELKMPFVVERWLGGTFTNFEVISKRAKYFKKLEEEKESGEFEKYTKKERVKKEKDLQSMGLKFEGLKNLDKMPNAVFIADIVKDKLALKEAFENKVEAIAIVDSNADPTLVDFPIPANDDAIPSVSYILSKIKAAYLNQ